VPISYQSQASLSFPRCVAELRQFWLKTVQNRPKPSKTVQNRPKPSKTVQSVFSYKTHFSRLEKLVKIAEFRMTPYDLTKKIK
jgi:hypothetical protein